MRRTQIFNRNPRLRGALLSALSAGDAFWELLFDSSRLSRVQILMLHEVMPEEEEGFCRLITELRREYRFISYSEAVDRIVEGRIDGRYLALSFDDGFTSVRHAADLLAGLGISACFFVCPSIVGETDDNKIRAFCLDRLSEKTIHAFLGWDDIERMAMSGHEIGAHTLTHANLARCGTRELQSEIHECYRRLSVHLGAQVRHFSWPFGHFSHINKAAVEAVFDAGFLSCASCERGCHVEPLAGANRRNLCLRRDQISASWPFSHIRYFLNRNARRASATNNGWPFAALIAEEEHVVAG